MALTIRIDIQYNKYEAQSADNLEKTPYLM